jgi:hypothetical protein
MQNSVAIGGMADIEQASPRSIWLKLPTMPVIAMLLATACQTPSFAETLISRVYTYKPPNMQQLRCLAECYSYSDSGRQQVHRQEWYCPNGYGMDIVGDLATMKRFNRVLAWTSGIEAGPMSRLALVALFGLIASVPSRQRATPAAPASRFQPFRFNAMSYDPCWPGKSTPTRFLAQSRASNLCHA